MCIIRIKGTFYLLLFIFFSFLFEFLFYFVCYFDFIAFFLNTVLGVSNKKYIKLILFHVTELHIFLQAFFLYHSIGHVPSFFIFNEQWLLTDKICSSCNPVYASLVVLLVFWWDIHIIAPGCCLFLLSLNFVRVWFSISDYWLHVSNHFFTAFWP